MFDSSLHESQQLLCSPQPVESNAVLIFQLSEQAEVVLKILNNAEETVRVLLNEKLDVGNYEIPFEAVNLPPGNYTARIVIGTQREVSIRNTLFQIQKGNSLF